jgi:hypothetical protein
MKKLLTSVAVIAIILTSPPAQCVEQVGDGFQLNGHAVSVNGAGNAPPTTTTCTLNAGSTDLVGGCAATATSGVAVIFGKAFLTAPTCVVLDHTTASGNALATEPTLTTFVLGTTVSGDKITWICMGKQGN